LFSGKVAGYIGGTGGNGDTCGGLGSQK